MNQLTVYHKVFDKVCGLSWVLAHLNGLKDIDLHSGRNREENEPNLNKFC